MKNIILFAVSLLLFACEPRVKEVKKEIFERKTEKVLERYSNGVKKLEGELVNGERHGTWKFYFENGFVWSEGKYWYGKRKGHSTVFYPSGKVQIEGTYKNDIKIGNWKLYDKDGSLNKTINMDKMLTKDDSLKLIDQLP